MMAQGKKLLKAIVARKGIRVTIMRACCSCNEFMFSIPAVSAEDHSIFALAWKANPRKLLGSITKFFFLGIWFEASKPVP